MKLKATEIFPGALASVQRVTTHASSFLEGSFTLTFRGQTTQAIEHDASAQDMKRALESLKTIGRVSISRPQGHPMPKHNESGPTPVNGYTWFVTFLSGAGTEQPLLVADTGKFVNGALQPHSHYLRGVSSDDATVTVSHVSSSTTVALGKEPYYDAGGDSIPSFTLSFRGEESSPLAFNASAKDVEQALEALPTLGFDDGYADVSVMRTALSDDGANYEWSVTFHSGGNVGLAFNERYHDMPMLKLDTSGLTVNQSTPSLCSERHRMSDGCTHTTGVVERRAGSHFGGTFTLGFADQITPPLQYDATEKDVRVAVAAMMNGVSYKDDGITNNDRDGSVNGTVDDDFFKYISVDRVPVQFERQNDLNLPRMKGPLDPKGTAAVFASTWSFASYSKSGPGVTGFNDGNDDGIRYGSGFRWCIEFLETRGDLEALTVNGNRLEGPGVTVASEEDIGGHEDIRGHFTLGFKGAKLQSMSALSHDATTTDFETALSQLNTVGSTRVTRAVVRDGKSEVGYTWNVTFTSLSTPSNIGADLPLFEVDSAMLSGTGLILKVERLVRGCCSFALSWNGGADFSTILSPALPFRFDRIPVVTRVYPKHGPASGGTILTVLGAGFWDSKVACLFGEFTKSSVLVDANRINSGEILCVVPRQTRPLLRDADNKLYQAGKSSSDQEPSSIRVRVVIGNIFASNSTSTSRSYFHYDRRAVITAIVPKSGPMTGGTAVRIYGRNFIQSDESRDSGSRSLDPNGGVLCRFGDGAVHVRGVFLSSGELECHSPRISTQGDFSGNPSSESNHETVFVPLEISLNGGADFTDSGIQFWYRPAPSVTVITPRRGPSRGGTKVLVQGKNFERSPLLRCKFGNSVESSSDSDSRETDAMLRGPSIVQATWISPSSLFCVSPVIESRPEVQVVTVRSNRIVRAEQLVRTLSLGPGHNITGGNFTLSFGDRHLSFESVLQRNPSWETTDPIPWNATADMVKDALMKLTSVVSVRVESVYSANHNTGSSSDHRPGPFGTFAWRVVFDKTPWRVPLLHTSNSGIGLLANGGGFAEVIPISEGTSFGVNLEENSITLSGPVKIDSIQEFSLQADNVVYATQVIRCFAAVSISATVLADSKFALKMDGTQVSILDEITYISCSGPGFKRFDHAAGCGGGTVGKQHLGLSRDLHSGFTIACLHEQRLGLDYHFRWRIYRARLANSYGHR